MTSLKIRSSSFYSGFIDLGVLIISFLVLAVITDFAQPMQLMTDLVFYVAIMFISLRICKRIIFEYIHTSTHIMGVLLGNVTGLIVGASLVMLIEQLLPGVGESIMIVILSSVLAFFILGTLSPMVKSSHHDIIHH